MANARPGGPRRPELDYYEYKRMHELRSGQLKNGAEKAPEQPKAPRSAVPAAPELQTRHETARPVKKPEDQGIEKLDTPIPEEFEGGASRGNKPSVFGGMRALMHGVVRRVPDEEEPEDDDDFEQPAVMRESPKQDSGFSPEEQPSEAHPPEDLNDGDSDDEDPGDDDEVGGLQIDNPIGEAFDKVKGLLGLAHHKIIEFRNARLAPEKPEEGETETEEEMPKAGQDSGSVLSRRARRAAAEEKARQESASQPPILDIRSVDEREVEDLVSKPGTTLKAGFFADPDDDDDDDDLPRTRGTKLFGFFKKTRGQEAEPSEDRNADYMPPNREDKSVPNDTEQAMLTKRLAEEMDSAPTLSRRERKALAAGKAASAEPEKSSAPYVAPRASTPVAATPFSTPTASHAAYPVDEPTQEFRPLRPRVLRGAAQQEPALSDDFADEEDEDDDLPLRKPAKPAREKKRRVYQDEDLDEEEEYDHRRSGRYDYDDYDDEYDEYDDYDEYDEEDYGDEYHVSGGRKLLGFLKGLMVFVLILALAVLALRQLEASSVISLNLLRSTIGQVIPIDKVLPSPVPKAAVETEAPLPSTEPTVSTVPEVTPSDADQNGTAPQDGAEEGDTGMEEGDMEEGDAA